MACLPSPALLALEFLITVTQDMLIQGAGILEDLLTLVTHVVVLFAVDLHMDVQSVGMSEDLAAYVTSFQTFSWTIKLNSTSKF